MAIRYLLITLCMLGSIAAKAQPDDKFFELPLIPDSVSTLQKRCDFMVTHYWDFCDTKKAFSARDKMAQAFDVYLSFMPYSSADVTRESIGAFMKRIEKQPADILFIGELAESKLYSDTATIPSDQLYLWFIEPIVKNKRVDRSAKMRFEHQASILARSQTGMAAPEFSFTDSKGTPGTWTPDTTAMATILFFNDPDCSECKMARLRLSLDIKTNRLIEAGVVKIISITPGDPDEEWLEAVSGYPANWTVGASPSVDEIYDLRATPSIYVLDDKGTILLKNTTPEVILNIMSQLRVPKIKEPRPGAES